MQKDIDAQVQITQTFTREAPKRIGNYADQQVEKLKEKAGKESDPEKNAQLLSEAKAWSEGGRYRIALHAATGALTGGVGGATGATIVASAAPTLDQLQASLAKALEDAGLNEGVAKATSSALMSLTASATGAVVGGDSGAMTGLGVDANNRQLHPTEISWIKEHAKRFAKQNSISEDEAEKRLAQQAIRQVQFGVSGPEDTQARNFLSQAKGMLLADPNCPTCGPGYMFYATPEQRASTSMYASHIASDPKTLEFYGKNGITQPTPQQIQVSGSKDADVRSTAAKATVIAGSLALATAAPPTLTWCLSNPVACNRIAISGGEIIAGDALGPTALGVVGTASAVKAVRSAEEVNALMKAHGWEPAWSPGTPVIEVLLQPGTKVNMIVDAKMADAIRKGDPIIPGGWGTFDSVSSVAGDMRQRAAITNQFKPVSDGPFYLIEMEVTQTIKSNIGFVGAQRETSSSLLRGGGTQIQFDEAINGADRNLFLKVSSGPKILR